MPSFFFFFSSTGNIGVFYVSLVYSYFAAEFKNVLIEPGYIFILMSPVSQFNTHSYYSITLEFSN